MYKTFERPFDSKFVDRNSHKQLDSANNIKYK